MEITGEREWIVARDDGKWERMSGNAFFGGKERKKEKYGAGNTGKSANRSETGEK